MLFWQCVKSNRIPGRDHCLFLCLFFASKALILVYLISCSLYNYPFKQTVFVDPASFYPCCYYIKVVLRETTKTLSRPRAKPSRRWPQDRRELLSTRRSWFTNGMTGRAELDRGRGLRDKCKSLSKTTWSHHERRQNNSVENVFQRFASSFVSFLRRKHDFRQRSPTFVGRILFEEPRIWASGFNRRTRVLKSVTACHAAKILPVGVRGTKNDWCLSSLIESYSNDDGEGI